jgi:hypothetical protein
MTRSTMTAIPINDWRTNQLAIFDQLSEAPVLLTRHGQAAGVLVHPETWHKLTAEVKQYRRLARIAHARREMDAGHFFTGQQVEALLAADGLLP